MVVEQALPLADHAEDLVADDDDLDIDVVVGNRREFLAVHHDAAVAREEDDRGIRTADLGTHRGRQAVAHCALAARRQEVTRLVDLEELCRPHLVLADIRHADRIAAHEAADLADERTRLDGLAFLAIAERMLCLELERMLKPRSELRGKVILARIELVAQEGQ